MVIVRYMEHSALQFLLANVYIFGNKQLLGTYKYSQRHNTKTIIVVRVQNTLIRNVTLGQKHVLVIQKDDDSL